MFEKSLLYRGREDGCERERERVRKREAGAAVKRGRLDKVEVKREREELKAERIRESWRGWRGEREEKNERK